MCIVTHRVEIPLRDVIAYLKEKYPEAARASRFYFYSDNEFSQINESGMFHMVWSEVQK